MQAFVLSFAKRSVFLFLLSCVATAQISVLTQGYDSARDGLNASETTLTLSSVSVGNFGKLFSLPVDGRVYAQPLYVPNVAIHGQGTHNAVYIATAHDSVYAYDADGLSIQPLWQASFINPSGGITTQPLSDNSNNSDIDSEIGIMGTPLIDAATGTLYVVAKTDETSGQTTTHCFRLHALDITSGADRTGSPTACIQASVTGTGSPSDGAGHVLFSADLELQRPGLALISNTVYAGFGGWSDTTPYHGWIIAFDKSSLQQVAAFNSTPNGGEGEGGIWMTGHGLAADTNGSLYFSTGNGAFDGANNFGDSYLRLTPGLAIADYFTPYNQHVLDQADLDVASGGLILLPDSAGTSQHPHIMIGCGKNGAIYVLDRDNMGHFNSSGDNQIIQELLNVIGGTTVNPNIATYVENCYTAAAYWQGNVYFGGVSDAVKMFSFTNGLLSTSAVSQSSDVYQFPGAIPSVSANGATNGIVWTIENAGPITGIGTATTAVLHAYDAANLANELYNSSQIVSDVAGAPVKFAVPVVANGKVYVGTQSLVSVYGLLTSMQQAAAPTFNPGGGNYSTAVSVTISEASPGTTIYYTTDGSIPTPSSNVYVGPILLTTNTILSAIAVGAGFRTSSVTVDNYVISGGPAFVQGNYAVPQSKQSTVTVAYPNAQGSANLNVVVVGWNDSTATITSGGVTDSSGNLYTLAVGPTVQSGTATQAIYYAKNIVSAAAGANTVMVRFSTPANAVDLRILEYSGLDGNSPFDAASGTSGDSTNSTVSLTTTNASDVLVGANLVQTGTTGPGAGFTSRMITAQDGDIVEDEAVTTAGSYTVNAPVSIGLWIMQAVAFKVAGNTNSPPTVTSISPTSGSTAGGTGVTITGTNFAAGATMTFGSAAATNVVVVSSTTITATTPVGSVGAVTVTVTNPDTQSGSLSNGFTYTSPTTPTVSSVAPNDGPAAGGTAVTITGTNFAGGAAVTFGGTAATNVVVVNSTTITATTPAHAAGAVTVMVTVNSQSGSLANGFTYVVSPTVSSVSPNSGSTTGGTAVTITGANFAAGATVTFGGTAATNVVVVNSTTITATTPAGSAGGVTVTVTNPGAQSGSLTNGYTYVVVPTVSSVAPNNGPAAGGTAVTITGTNFAGGAAVTFGGTAATNVVVVNGTTITATTPAHAAGGVTVTVTVNGQSGSLASGFTYNGTVAISFAQVASATPQTSTATVSVTYPGAQTAGDLNVVVVGWNDTTATVQSVKDSGGNNYNLAIGPTSGTALRQSIYYLSNIAGGNNTVTVTFTQAAVAPDVRILEYRGVTTLDARAGASGSSTAANSGAATTTSANELIFGANMVDTLTRAAGSGFTSRIITSPDGDIAEDKVVTTAGSNSATATLSSTGPWVMQMVTFSAVSGPVPTVTSVAPNSGSTAGGTAVTITGTNFVSGATATFGGKGATNVVVVNSTTMTATTPAGSTGAVTVTVTNPGGQSGSLASAFTYIAPPTVSSVAPNNGPAAGGTAVTITGTNFAAEAAVTFGGTAATNVVVVNSTTITAATPAGSAGTVTVTVINGNGLSGSLANGFTYVVSPTVSSVSPNSGSTTGGTAVTITGTNFAAGATVTFGGTAATNVVVVNSTTITATTPAGSAGGVTVTVTNAGAQSGSLTNGYTYVVVPTVSSVAPNNGPAAGGTAVAITGTNFAGGAAVTFGGTAATNVVVVNGTTITATTPAHAAGAVTVMVTVNSQSGSLANGFTYVVSPTVSSVSPNSGSTTGGTAVTITGANFAAGATVTFGGTAATNVVVVNSTTITATTPAGSAGGVTVTVTNPGAQSGSLTNGYTYVVVPTVSSVAPNNGPAAGGTAVTITGTNFAGGAAVTFGGTAATNVVVVNGTTITATTPAHAAGGVTVTVTVNGQSGSLASGFTYNGTVAISFAQVASATPQTSTATVSVTYPGAQTAGDLNVVVVGWNDTTATVQSVKDSGGNNYNLAIGPTSGTALRQSIYYLSNIAGGNNTVTVTFSQPAAFPDVRILEYRGVTAVDVTAGASGSSTAANSGAATTTSANELIFGANMVDTLTGAAGSGFTSRIITSPDGDIAEDKVVTTAGSNSATATLSSSGPWVMQMVTLK